MIRNVHTLLSHILSIHEVIRDGVVHSCENAASEQLATIVSEQAGDTIFALDRISEENSAPLSAPLDVTTGIAWIGYANDTIYHNVASILQSILRQNKLIAVVP